MAKTRYTKKEMVDFYNEIIRIFSFKNDCDDLSELQGVLINEYGAVQVQFEDSYNDLEWYTIDLADFGKPDHLLIEEYNAEKKRKQEQERLRIERCKEDQRNYEIKKYLELKAKYGNEY